jgi:hypothetical protein
VKDWGRWLALHRLSHSARELPLENNLIDHLVEQANKLTRQKRV